MGEAPVVIAALRKEWALLRGLLILVAIGAKALLTELLQHSASLMLASSCCSP